MKKIRRLIISNRIYLAAIALTLVICGPLVSTLKHPATINEEVLVSLSRGVGNVMYLRLVVLALILINLTLVYRLFTRWFGKKRAGLSVVVLASIPSWLLMQVTVPRFTVLLTSMLIALWAFNNAGRADKPTAWYWLSGLGLTAAWLQEPVGVMLVASLCTALLLAVKPRYIKHIARQASLVLIILAVTVGSLLAASWRFSLGFQEYLVRQFSTSLQIVQPQLTIDGVLNYHVGLPGTYLIPLAVIVLAGLGAWQMFLARKRPRNVFLLVLPVAFAFLAPQLRGLGMLLLLSLGIVGLSSWATMGIQWLHTSWQRVFPHNRLANNVGDGLIILMVVSLTVYSFWFVAIAWSGNPEARSNVRIEWNGGL